MAGTGIQAADTTAMLIPYMKKNDSTIYYSKYKSDTSRTNIYSGINTKLAKSDTSTLSARIDLKLNISDTSNMLSKYLRKIDTSTLSTRIDTKLAITDTSVFQRKSLASYTFQANNTTATANATAQTFKDSGSKVYGGTLTWTSASPSGASNLTYRWSQIGKLVTLRINISYATAATLTQLVATLPSDCPSPEIPTGLNAASTILFPVTGYLFTSPTTPTPTTAAATIGYLRTNASNNGFEIVLLRGSGSVAAAYIIVNYFAQ
jgi:hypothetical protein